MAVEERRRIALHRTVVEAWGQEAADTLIELVTPAGEEPATARHIRDARAATSREFAEHRAATSRELAEHRAETSRELAEHRAETSRGLAEHRAETSRELAEHRVESARRFEEVFHELAMMEQRLVALIERRMNETVTAQTRTLVFSQLAALVAITALAFGLR